MGDCGEICVSARQPRLPGTTTKLLVVLRNCLSRPSVDTCLGQVKKKIVSCPDFPKGSGRPILFTIYEYSTTHL